MRRYPSDETQLALAALLGSQDEEDVLGSGSSVCTGRCDGLAESGQQVGHG